MKERPLLMSATMVRATLRQVMPKTKTRRGLRVQPFAVAEVPSGNHLFDFRHDKADDTGIIAMVDLVKHCPYGVPGDRLWIRENGWERPPRTSKMMREGADTWAPYYYDADELCDTEVSDLKAWGFKRRPSIHMPRWASRITLEIVDVRVERLHDISDEDAIAEGIEPDRQPGDCVPLWRNYLSGGTTVIPARSFETLWKTINGAASWDANPWVWVVEFKRITQGEAP